MQATDQVLVSSLTTADKTTDGYLSLYFVAPQLSDIDENMRSTMPVAPANSEISEKAQAFQEKYGIKLALVALSEDDYEENITDGKLNFIPMDEKNLHGDWHQCGQLKTATPVFSRVSVLS